MPLFRYVCKDCKHEFELLQLRFDSPAICPKCGSGNNSKLPSRIGGIATAGPRSCASRNDCPSAGGYCCGDGCCHHRH